MTTCLDSSVLVKAYCLEPTSPQALVLLGSLELPFLFTALHTLEIKNALRLKRHRKELSRSQMEGALGNLQDDLESGVLHIPDLDFPAVFHRAELLSAAHTPFIGTRSLDILHVASALTLGCMRFASFDRRQRMLARKAGLRILPRALQGPGT